MNESANDKVKQVLDDALRKLIVEDFSQPDTHERLRAATRNAVLALKDAPADTLREMVQDKGYFMTVAFASLLKQGIIDDVDVTVVVDSLKPSIFDVQVVPVIKDGA